MRAILFISFVLISGILSAQNFSVNLSQKHLTKLERYKSGHKRLKQYYKFYRKDSIEHRRRQNRKFRNELDSDHRGRLKNDKLRRRLAREGITWPNEHKVYADSLDEEIKRCWKTLNDSSSPDSIKLLMKERVRRLVVQKAKLSPGFQSAIVKSVGSDTLSWQHLVTGIPGLDTLSALFDSSPDEFFMSMEQTVESYFMKHVVHGLRADFNHAQQLMELPRQYKDQLTKLGNKDSLQSTAKHLATAEALKQFQDYAPISNAQQQVSRLLSKYQQFANSGDLSTAVKHTSMKGKAFREHLVIGGNFNVLSVAPVSIDLSPQIGYKFTTRFVIGAGINYRFTAGDSIRSGYYISPHNWGYKALATYNVASGFFATVEWEKSTIKTGLNESTKRQWKDNVFIGIGKRFLIHPKMYLTITGFYNLNDERQNPVHRDKFQLRMGLQLSEFGMRNQRVCFNPNR